MNIDIAREKMVEQQVRAWDVFDEDVPLHNSYRQIMEHRQQLTCKRIVLTHMSDLMLSRLREVELPTDIEARAISATYRNGLLWIELPKKR